MAANADVTDMGNVGEAVVDLNALGDSVNVATQR